MRGARLSRRLLAVGAALVMAACGDGNTKLDADESTTTTESSPSTSTTLEGAPVVTTTSSAPTGDRCAQPDRGRILFHRTMPGSVPIWHVFSVSPDGSCLRQITQGTAHVLNWGASWSPDGRRIAFIRKDAGVMLADWDGGNERLLLAETDVQPSGAHTDWSPDGKRLVVQRQQGLWVVDVSTGAARNITANVNAGYASWSPDGTRIVYADFDMDSGSSVVIVDADGSNRRVLAPRATQPDWSTNNRIVMFRADELVVMGADGSDPYAIPGSRDHGAPRWNTGGTSVVASIGPGGMRVFPDDGENYVVNTNAATTGGADFADDW